MNWLMRLSTYKYLFYLLFFFVFLTVKGQNATIKELEELSVSIFNNGEYLEASKKFEILISKYPKETAYNYYLGRCFLELNNSDLDPISLLKYAASQNYNADVHFYLALAYYNNCQNSKGDVSMNNFMNLAKKKDLKQLSKEIRQSKIQEAKTICIETKKEQTEGIQNTTVEAVPVATVITSKKPEVLDKKHLINYDTAMQQALEQQLVCDSLQMELASLNNSLQKTVDTTDRRELFSAIAAIKTQINTEELLRDDMFVLAESLAPNVESKHSNAAVFLKEEINGLKVYTYKNEAEKKVEPIKPKVAQESLAKSVVEQGDEKSEFAILDSSPYNSTNSFIAAGKMASGLVYRIQLGAFGTERSFNAFGGLSPIFEEIIKERDILKYYVGSFFSSKEARVALQEVKNYGYTDAFIVSYYNKEKISIQEAREIEFGQKSRVE